MTDTPAHAGAEVVGETGDDGVLTVTFNRPDRLNAFTHAGYRQFLALLAHAASDPAVHVVLVRGAGRAFSSGVDVTALERKDRETLLELSHAFGELVPTLTTFPKPLVAAVHGYAVGFGCTMLLHFDLVLVADDARLRMPFVELGVTPEAASSVLLPDRIGWQPAAWHLLSGEWIDAPTAVQLGIAWRACGSPAATLAEARAIARRLADGDPAATQAAKRLLVEGRREAVLRAFAREQGQ
ncbi:MAG TPA: enoyl-CoA hydratase/isomerase family protein [Acidimicrobiia bacterium]|nr:enoyl-CoA hydratase/isomerase family protein [Acidimicrobiia bacterium]